MIPYRISTILPFFILGSFVAAGPLGGPDSKQLSKEQKEKAFTDSVEDYIVNFMLFTRQSPEKFYLLQVNNKLSISRSTFDPSKDTKIIIHGWKNGYNSNFSQIVKDGRVVQVVRVGQRMLLTLTTIGTEVKRSCCHEGSLPYLKKYDVNVINVDWSDQSHINYVSSRLDVEKVANVVAQMVDLLVKEFGMQSSKVHIVGHSLGAHVAGIAGLRMTTGNVSRITGLDPALPLFSTVESTRLRSDSADFVDVIHTCGNLLAFGTPLGQVDFFPNSGDFEQPGCGFDYKGKCSHGRSYLYFAESILGGDFLAVKCKGWIDFLLRRCDQTSSVLMGEFTPRTARGSYYLRTNDKAPFAVGSQIFFPPTTTEVPDYYDMGGFDN